jgi:hypothetical protein
VTIGLTADEHDDGCTRDGDCSCERQSFSWQRCDLCDTTLGGERHAVTFWTRTVRS